MAPLRIGIPLLLGLLLAVARAPPSVASDPNTFAKPNWDMYNSYDNTMQRVADMVARNPKTMRMRTVTASSIEGSYKARMPLVVVEPGGLSSGTVPADKLRVFYNFGEHGREIITTELALRVLEMLESVETLTTRIKFHEKFHEIIAQYYKTVFYIVPVENEGGRHKVEAGELCERKNGRGVDTNRNWELDWGVKERDYDPSEEYPGNFPYSEPEAFVLHAELAAFKPHVWVNVHSGMEALFMPYDHKREIPSGSDASQLYHMLEMLNRWHCKSKCAVGSGGKEVGYRAHGTATDTIYTQLGVPMVMTWEVYGVTSAHYDDCFRMFNPTDRHTFDELLDRWGQAFFAVLPLASSHNGVQSQMQRDRVVPTSAFYERSDAVLQVTRTVEPKVQTGSSTEGGNHQAVYRLRGDPTPSYTKLPSYLGSHNFHQTFRNMPPTRIQPKRQEKEEEDIAHRDDALGRRGGGARMRVAHAFDHLQLQTVAVWAMGTFAIGTMLTSRRSSGPKRRVG